VGYFPFRTHKPDICCGHSRALLFIYLTHATLQCSDAVATADGGVAAAQLLSDFEHQALSLPLLPLACPCMHRCQPCPLLKTAGSHRSLTCPAILLRPIVFSHRHTLISPPCNTSPPPSPSRHPLRHAPRRPVTAPPRRPVNTSAATRDPCPQLDDGTSQCALAQGT
jgi:hypothetical protein